MFDYITEFNERRKIVSELKTFNEKYTDKFFEMEQSRKRIVDDFIYPVVGYLRRIVPAHMDPTEFQRVLMRMKRRIETPARKFKELLLVRSEYVKELNASITDLEKLSSTTWRNKVKQCEKLNQRLQVQLLKFLSVTKEAEEILYM